MTHESTNYNLLCRFSIRNGLRILPQIIANSLFVAAIKKRRRAKQRALSKVSNHLDKIPRTIPTWQFSPCINVPILYSSTSIKAPAALLKKFCAVVSTSLLSYYCRNNVDIMKRGWKPHINPRKASIERVIVGAFSGT